MFLDGGVFKQKKVPVSVCQGVNAQWKCKTEELKDMQYGWNVEYMGFI